MSVEVSRSNKLLDVRLARAEQDGEVVQNECSRWASVMNRGDTTGIGSSLNLKDSDHIEEDHSGRDLTEKDSSGTEVFATAQPSSLQSRFLQAAASRFTEYPPAIVLIQLFLALGWSRAVAEKVIDPAWWNNDTVRAFIAEAEQPIDWYYPLAEKMLLPAAMYVTALTLTLQLGALVSMLSGRFLNYGIAAGMFMNINFLAMGEINPSVFYLILQGALALWLAENSEPIPRVRTLRLMAGAGAALSITCAPFIKTIHPYRVLDDVGIMMTTGGLLTILVCDLATRRLHGQGLLGPTK